MAGEADRLVADALHQAAVAGDRPRMVVDQRVAVDRVEVTLGDRHADRGRQPLTQRAGGGLDTLELEVLGVTGAGGPKLAEGLDVVDRRPRVAGQVE